jgi:hypothetical protein
MNGIIICGPAKGEDKKYKCICCGWETDDLEQIAVNMCWDCVFGYRAGCESCQALTGSEILQ